MFNQLFCKSNDTVTRVDKEINDFYKSLKEIYNYDEISEDRKSYLASVMEEYGYLNYPHIKALEELSPAETLFCLDTKFKIQNGFAQKVMRLN